jgi:hypothetical protein
MEGFESRRHSSIEEIPEIVNAQSWEELYQVVTRLGGLRGSSKFWTAEALIHLTDGVREGKLHINELTSSGGYRATVSRLGKLELGLE